MFGLLALPKRYRVGGVYSIETLLLASDNSMELSDAKSKKITSRKDQWLGGNPPAAAGLKNKRHG
ncbi:hypothetical protein KJ866_02290, partial [Patescibacteria group bacterium]|nr:hypothetical protein [Patescibacteria group bacterium]